MDHDRTSAPPLSPLALLLAAACGCLGYFAGHWQGAHGAARPPGPAAPAATAAPAAPAATPPSSPGSSLGSSLSSPHPPPVTATLRRDEASALPCRATRDAAFEDLWSPGPVHRLLEDGDGCAWAALDDALVALDGSGRLVRRVDVPWSVDDFREAVVAPDGRLCFLADDHLVRTNGRGRFDGIPVAMPPEARYGRLHLVATRAAVAVVPRAVAPAALWIPWDKDGPKRTTVVPTGVERPSILSAVPFGDSVLLKTNQGLRVLSPDGVQLLARAEEDPGKRDDARLRTMELLTNNAQTASVSPAYDPSTAPPPAPPVDGVPALGSTQLALGADGSLWLAWGHEATVHALRAAVAGDPTTALHLRGQAALGAEGEGAPFVRCAMVDRRGVPWVAGTRGVWRGDGGQLRPVPLTEGPYRHPAVASYGLALVPGSDAAVLGCSKGLYRLTDHEAVKLPFPGEETSWTVLLQPAWRPGPALVHTSGGLWRLDPAAPAPALLGTWPALGCPDAAENSWSSRFTVGIDGAVWALVGGRLSKLEGGRLREVTGAPALSSHPNVLDTDRAGGLWVDGAGQSVLVLAADGLAVRTRMVVPLVAASHMACDGAGSVWLGASGGLWLVVGHEARLAVPGLQVLDLSVATDGALWALGYTTRDEGNQGLLLRATSDGYDRYHVTAPPVGYGTRMTVDGRGRIWLAKLGLWHFEPAPPGGAR